MLRTLLAAFVASLVGCASAPPVRNDLSPGLYREIGPLDPSEPEALRGRHVWTFAILDRPLRRWSLPWGALADVDYFPVEGSAWFCLIEEMRAAGHSSEWVVSFDTPVLDSSGQLRWRAFETHHFEAWLEVRQDDEAISGVFRSRGWGGPKEIPVLAPKVGGAPRATCLAAVDALMDD